MKQLLRIHSRSRIMLIRELNVCMWTNISISKCKYKSIQSIANKHLGIHLFVRLKQDNVPSEMYLSFIYSVFSAKDSLEHLIVIFNGCCFPILVLHQFYSREEIKRIMQIKIRNYTERIIIYSQKLMLLSSNFLRPS